VERHVNINNSALQTYLKCGTKYEFEYIKKVKRPQTWQLFRGTALHSVRKTNLWQTITTKEDLPLEELKENAFEIVREAEFLPPDTDIEKPETSVLGGVEKDFTVFQQTTQPDRVEHCVHILPDGYDYELFGTIDLVDREGTRIRDLKTTAKAPNVSDVLNSTQLTTYQLFAMAEGMSISEIRHDYLIFYKREIKTDIIHTGPRTKDDIRALLNTYQNAVTMIGAGVFLPAPAGSWWCSPKWCCYYAVCPHITKAAKSYFLNNKEDE
jgi:hypothetical protein